jgi:hypothetical protein
MDFGAQVVAIRARAAELRFESPSRGAVCLTRLSYGLPPSESLGALAALSEVDRALAVIRRTIRHSHAVNHGLDQFGNGYWVCFSRHVTEGGRRWEVEVDVTVDRQHNAVISDVRMVRPGYDDEDEEDDDNGADEEPEAKAAEPEAPPSVPFGMVACPCCGRATLETRGQYEICPVCFWEDDGQDNADASVARGGPNRVSLVEGRANFLRFGASVEADREKVRAPTEEETQLRRFADDGQELSR